MLGWTVVAFRRNIANWRGPLYIVTSGVSKPDVTRSHVASVGSPGTNDGTVQFCAYPLEEAVKGGGSSFEEAVKAWELRFIDSDS